jgi:hypothetical protein
MPTKRTKPTSRPSTAADTRRAGRALAAVAATPPAPSYADIAARAYALFLERGAEHGSDQEDWLRAEQELKSR